MRVALGIANFVHRDVFRRKVMEELGGPGKSLRSAATLADCKAWEHMARELKDVQVHSVEGMSVEEGFDVDVEWR
jgi:hypothetical protein